MLLASLYIVLALDAFFGVTDGKHLSICGLYYNMAGFEKTVGPQDPNEDVIIIHLGRSLTNEQFERVQQSIIAFMNTRWPNPSNIGTDS